MSETTPTIERPEPDFNTRQWRFVDFCVRKSCRWEAADFDSSVLVISPLGDRSNRTLTLYRSGTTRTGVRVALIDPSLSPKKGLRWLTQRDAWSLLAEGGL